MGTNQRLIAGQCVENETLENTQSYMECPHQIPPFSGQGSRKIVRARGMTAREKVFGIKQNRCTHELRHWQLEQDLPSSELDEAPVLRGPISDPEAITK